MLTLTTGVSRDCDRISRRSFVQVGALAGLGVSLPLALAAKKAAAAEKGSGVNCILVWTRGGTSHHDTFDPKPDAPVSVKGEFGVIDTAIPGLKFTDVVPTFAKEIKRFGLLRLEPQERQPRLGRPVRDVRPQIHRRRSLPDLRLGR